MFQFDLQLFGGKGGSTTTVSERPLTEDELRLIKAQADVAEAFQPNILGLNDYAMNLLKDSIGANQLNFYDMNNNSQKQIADNMAKYGSLADFNNLVAGIADGKLDWLSGIQEMLATSDYDKVQNLANGFETATDATNKALSQYISGNNSAVNNANNALGDYIGNNTEAVNSANADLTRYINQNDVGYSDVERALSGLQNGVLPSAYQQNMTDAIHAALDATIGENLNNLSQRGVLNSSVTDSALNAIEGNAANAVAQNYLQNINTLQGLAQNRFSDNAVTTAANANLAQQQLQNITNESEKNAALVQQQYENTVNNSNTNANLQQQQLGNTANANANTQNAIDYNYNRINGAANNYANLTQQRVDNWQNASNTNAGLYQGMIQNASAPITTAAGAQEAAQAPARNLWDASMGLTSTNNGTLAAIAGAQPKSTTTTTENSGGFWGGLLGGAASVFCFPKGTLVRMADGNDKDIAEIVVGDEVIDKDGNTAKVILLMPEHKNEVWELRTKNGAVTRTTSTQPFFLEDGSQKELRYLTPDDVLLNMGKIESIKRDGYERVYDFETDGENNYIVDGGFVAQGGGVDWWED